VKKIYVRNSEDDEAIGSGFVLEDRRFVTAFHCIEGKTDVQVDGWDKGFSVAMGR
jgi:hypothetical protein